MIQISIASDHAGFELKSQLIKALRDHSEENVEIQDLGPFDSASVDYPDYANKLCPLISPQISDEHLKDFGILICGSGQGMALRANKFSHIRAALVYSDEIAILARQHNNANIICLGSRFCTVEQAYDWTNLFKKTAFAGGRHQTRVAKISSPIS